MNRILTDLGQYVFDKIEVVIVFLIVAGGMYIVNMVLYDDFPHKKEFL